MQRTLVHLDADAFFAAVEQASDSKLRGRPVAVGGEKRGIIASASYEARRFGVHTPMPTARARKLCPNLIVLPGDFERYEQFSNWMFGYCYDFTPDVEQTSIDEGYFELTAVSKPAESVAQLVRQAIGQRLKITVSEGIGANKLVSAIASKLTKPAGFTQVPAGQEVRFLHPLEVRWLPGVGPGTSSRMRAAGLVQIRQVAATPLDMLELLLGRQAADIHRFSQGIDDRPLIPASVPQKTFSQQETFERDLTDEPYARAILRRMADELFARVREEKRSIRTLTVRVRYNDMEEDQVSESLREPTDLETEVYGRLDILLRTAWRRRVSLRLVSLKLSNLYDNRFQGELQGELSVRNPLGMPGNRRESRARLADAVDALRRMHGPSILMRGHDFRLKDAPLDLLESEPETNVKKPSRPRSNSGVLGPVPAPVSVTVSYRRKSSGSPALPYVPLRVHSHYSFLDSLLSPQDIVDLAVRHELPVIALTDTGNLHGAPEFARAASQAGVKPVFGVELVLDGCPLVLYVENAVGYGNLCKLLSRLARRDSGRGEGLSVVQQQRRPIHLRHLESGTEGLIAVGSQMDLAEYFPGRFYRRVSSRTMPADFPSVACPSVHYDLPEDRQRFDILQSIRTLTLLREEHPEKQLGGSLHFRSPDWFRMSCREHPDWLAHTIEIASRCSFVFPFGKPQFPEFHPPDLSTPSQFLRRLVMEGLERRYGSQASQHIAQVTEELGIIADVGYEAYFLGVWSLLQDCRARGIDWITRGSAADSLVCYCLGISDVCPIRFDLYFKRFLNPERMALNKLPDIDVDFPHDRKDEVMQGVLDRFGPDQSAVVGGFSTFQARSAFAEVAKVLGMAEREVRRFTEHFPWGFGGGWVPDEPAPRGERLIELLQASPETRSLPLDEEPYKTALETAAFLDGRPRYPKMHPCGVVLSRQPIRELTPTFISNKGLPTTHYEMDAVEAMGLIKIDILAQGGLAVMRDTLARLNRCRTGAAEGQDEGDEKKIAGAVKGIQGAAEGEGEGEGNACRVKLPSGFEDPHVWDMIAGGGARAVHHIESPAMTSLCQMTGVREIDGLIAVVSVIRPGAANESKKLSFTRRYQGWEPVTYPHPSLEPCLRSTFGLVVYEEHILQICEAFAGMTAGQADVLRRALVKQKRATVAALKTEFISAAIKQGRADADISQVWDLVTSFNGYAFNKAHSTAYGVEAYQAAWLKYYYPAEFLASVLTHRKGFYHPLVYVLECHRLGIRFLSPSVNDPGPDFEVVRTECPETTGEARLIHGSILDPTSKGSPTCKRYGDRSIRVPLTSMKGLTDRTLNRMLSARRSGVFTSLKDFYQRVLPSTDELESMIRVGAFDLFGDTRTRQFWQAQHLLKTFGGLNDSGQGWLIPPSGLEAFASVPLEEPTRLQRLRWEVESFEFVISGHPLELFPDVAWETYCPISRLNQYLGEIVTTCGLVVEQRTHHQITGEPMKFLSLADWTGIVETELFSKTYKSFGLATIRYPVLEVEARVEPFENGKGYTLHVLRAGPPRGSRMN